MTTFRTISGADWALAIERARREVNPVASEVRRRIELCKSCAPLDRQPARGKLERRHLPKKSLAAETSHLRKKESK